MKRNKQVQNTQLRHHSYLDDDAVIAHAEEASNSDKFKKLYAGDWEELYDSQSDADMALLSILAFWCGCDEEQMDRIFRTSGLMRDKWDRRQAGTTYHEAEWNGGTVYMEDEYPHILFAKDGELYDIGGQRTFVIGGAYSVDKAFRLLHGLGWWPDEQPSEEIKRRIEENLDEIDWSVDVVLTHTAPLSPKRTLEAAAPYAYAGKKVCILNFASATNPGGGVTKGSSAQEEAICRCSTLYANLKEQYAWNAFYSPHRRAHDPLHNDDCIYTPGVMVFKSDTDYPQLLPEDKWYSVNVLTCAAPNLRERPSNEMNAGDGDAAVHISREDLQALHEKRMRRVLEIAWRKGNEVVILGAFGCGAFRNPPAVVAQAMKTAVQEYRKNFETIEFAVYCGTQYDTNYRVFQQILSGL